MKHTHCTICHRPLRTGGTGNTSNARCLICRTARLMRGWRYEPQPWAGDPRDEATWAARPEAPIDWGRA